MSEQQDSPAPTKSRVANTRRRSPDPDGFPRRIDVSRFKEIGRINRPSGATSWDDYDDRVAVLDELYDTGNLDLLRDFRDGNVRMNDLMRLKRLKRLDNGAGALRLGENLLEAIDRIVPKLGGRKKTGQNYQALVLRLVASSVPKFTTRSTVRDLEKIDWEKTGERWAENGGDGASTWNNLVIALGSFLSTLLGDSDSPERKRIMSRIPRASAGSGRVPDATIEQVTKVILGMPARTGPSALTLLLTGLRTEELLGAGPSALRPNIQAIAIEKKGRRLVKRTTPFATRLKNAPSEGLVYVPQGFWDVATLAVTNPPGYVTLRRHWCQRCHEVGLGTLTRTKNDPGQRWPQTFRYTGMTLHDLRHCYGQWVHGAGMPLGQLRHALRHEDESSTARYAQQAAKQDAARLVGEVFGAFDPKDLWPVATDGSDDTPE